jgi:hypothetical protein
VSTDHPPASGGAPLQSLGPRARRWLLRYGPAEGLSLVFTVVGSLAVFGWTGSAVAAGIAGTWADNLGYYGWILARDLRGHRSAASLGRAARNLVLEFGPGELLDSFLVRPVALSAALAWLGPPLLAAVVGKLGADVLFYLPTLASHELLRRVGAREE